LQELEQESYKYILVGKGEGGGGGESQISHPLYETLSLFQHFHQTVPVDIFTLPNQTSYLSS